MTELLSKQPDISVIIPTRNKPEYLFITLMSFCCQTLPFNYFEILVICNGENKKASELNFYITKINWPFTIKVFTVETANVSNARNIGISSAKGKFIVFVDDDCPVERHFLSLHLNSHLTGQKCYVVGNTKGLIVNVLMEKAKIEILNFNSSINLPKKNTMMEQLNEFYNSPKSYLLSRMADAYNRNFREHSEDFPDWILFIPRNVSISRENLQMFDTKFSGWGMEDWELGYRLYKSGIRASVNPLCLNYHLSHSTSSRKYRSFLYNCYLFIRKHPEYQAFLGVRFNPRSIDNPSILNQSIFGISLEKFVECCRIYKQKHSLQKNLMFSTAKTIAYLHLASELPKALRSKTLTD